MVTVIGQFGHCNQELINLLLTGRATSNVFDGELSMGGSSSGGDALHCRGLRERSSVGYLSYLESLRYLQVGRLYKVPVDPVWVVGSETHFTVLFSPNR